MSGLTVFLAGRFSLFENEAADPCANVETWAATFGDLPSFDEPSDCVRGLHFPLDDEERGMVVAHSAGPDAVLGAIRLLKLKYDLYAVRLMNKPPYGTGYSVDDLDSLGEAIVSVWPCEPTHPVRDTVVARSTVAPGYLHRLRANAKCLWAALAPRVEEAYQWPSAREAIAWLSAHDDEPEAPFRLVWRSVALSEQDRDDSAYKASPQEGERT